MVTKRKRPGLEVLKHWRARGNKVPVLILTGSLLDNACKWSRGLVMLALHNQQRLWVTVEDDGPGCDTAQLARLTQRGVRADENVDGSGLGLSIVREIVQLYQGTIDFERSRRLGAAERHHKQSINRDQSRHQLRAARS